MSTTRMIVSATIKYGHFPEFLAALKEITPMKILWALRASIGSRWQV